MFHGVTLVRSKASSIRADNDPEPPSATAPITRTTVSTIWAAKKATTANRMPTSGFHQA